MTRKQCKEILLKYNIYPALIKNKYLDIEQLLDDGYSELSSEVVKLKEEISKMEKVMEIINLTLSDLDELGKFIIKYYIIHNHNGWIEQAISNSYLTTHTVKYLLADVIDYCINKFQQYEEVIGYDKKTS